MKTIINYILVFFFFFPNISLASKENPQASTPQKLNAEKIYKNVLQAYKNIKSYSYTNYQGGYDWFVKKALERAKSNYAPLISRYGNGYENGSNNHNNQSSEFKKGIYGYKFLKPFNIQMALVESDYVPSILNNSVLTYRPDKNPKTFKFYPRASSFSLTRSIYEESGNFLTMNWTVDLLMMQLQHENGTLRLAEKEKVDGRDCYVLEFSFKKDREPFIIKQNLKSHGIPVDINPQICISLFDFIKKKLSKVKYWIDNNKFIIVKIEEYIDDKFYSSKEYRNIKINNLSLEDF